MDDDATDTDEPDTPVGETSGADGSDSPDERPPDDDGERILEREGLATAADDDSIADSAVQELREAVADDRTTDESASGESAPGESASGESAPDEPSPDESIAGTAERGLSTDALFELLSSPGNRFVLTYLLRAENPTTYAELVDYVVERAEPPAAASEAKFRGRVAARLVHGTIPTLADAGLIEHDGEEQAVRATPAIETVAPHLALAMSRSVAADDAG